MNGKKIFQSKTIWFGLFVAALPFFMAVMDILIQYDAPSWSVSIIGGIIILLRFVTREPLQNANDVSNTEDP